MTSAACRAGRSPTSGWTAEQITMTRPPTALIPGGNRMRVNDVDPADMTDDQRTLYEWYTTGRRASPDSPFQLSTPDGRLQGPPAAWILSPAFGHALQRLGGAV